MNSEIKKISIKYIFDNILEKNLSKILLFKKIYTQKNYSEISKE